MPSSNLSRLRIVLRNGVQKTLVEQEGRVQEQFEALISKERSCSTSCRLFHAKPVSTFTDLHLLSRPGTICAATSDLLVVNRKRNLTVVGAVSRTFSTPSVSGPSFQVCGYHIDRTLSGPGQNSASSKCQKNPMTFCGSGASIGAYYLENIFLKDRKLQLSTNIGNLSCRKNVSNCGKASMSFKKQDQPKSYQIYGYVIYNAAKRWYNIGPHIALGLRDIHSLSSICFSPGTAPDMSFDNLPHEELNSSEVSSEKYVLLFTFSVILVCIVIPRYT